MFNLLKHASVNLEIYSILLLLSNLIPSDNLLNKISFFCLGNSDTISIRSFFIKSLFILSIIFSIILSSNESYLAKYLNKIFALLITSSCTLSSKKISKILFSSINFLKTVFILLLPEDSLIISLISFNAFILFSKFLHFKHDSK